MQTQTLDQPSVMTIDKRIESLREAMRKKKLDAFVVTHLPGIRYLTKFSGSNALLVITHDELHFFTDDRYTVQIQTELHKRNDLRTYIQRDMWGYMKSENLLKGTGSIGFDPNKMSYAAAMHARKVLKPARLVAVKGLVEQVTMPKTAEEIAHIQRAADIVSEVYQHILGFVKPGMKETDVAAEISYQMRKRGSQGDAFEIICVSGERGALIHGRASDKSIQSGEFVTLDFGAIVNGYNSDMTRTFAVGQPTDEMRRVYDIVLESEQKGVAAVKTGVKAKHIDDICRGIIDAAGYGETFQHSTGHGLGIEVHESPGLSFRAKDTDLLRENSIVTVEPGIYIAGKFGLRIEDDVLVTNEGPKVLTSAPRELIIV